MKAEDLIGLDVIDIATGTTVGSVSGMLIDQEEKRVLALQIGRGTLSGHYWYVSYDAIGSIQHDAATIPSESSLLDRGDFKSTGVTDHITGRKVVTEDGKNLGTIKSYSIEAETGRIESITFAVDREVMGGLWKSAGDSYDIPGVLIKTLGELVVVDSSAPDAVGLPEAA